MNKMISIVISLYNEEEGVPSFWASLRTELIKITDVNFEVIWVNDGSTDQTQSRVEMLTTSNADQTITHCSIEFSRNFGHESAMIAGIDHAKGDAVVCMDGDGQHPPAEIENMLHAYRTGSDFVLMECIQREDNGSVKRLLSALFYKVINQLSTIKLRNNATDFFLISRQVAETLKTNYREQNRFIRGFIQSIGFSSVVLPFYAPSRLYGKSNYSLFRLFKHAFNAIPREKSGKAGKDKLKKEPSMPILIMLQISSTHGRLISQTNNKCRARHVPGKIFSMNRVILFFLVTLILFSCSPGPKTITPVSVKPGQVVNSDSVITITVDVPEMAPFNIDDRLFDVKYIPLETNRQSIIGEISKVIYFNERFYILDADITGSVYIFDKEGKYINKISRKGGGPGEYTRIYDFDIDRSANEMVILTGGPLKIIRNTMEGKFISEIHPPCYADRFTALPDKSSAIYLEYGDNTPFLKEEYNLIFIDSTAVLKGGVLRYDHSHICKHFSKGLSTFYYYDGGSYFYPALNDTVYRVGPNQITPVYAFDFGKDSFDKEVLQQDINEQDSYFAQHSYASFFSIFETDQVLCFFFSCDNGLYRGYYSKVTGKTFVGAICANNKYPLGSPIGNTDEALIDQLTPLVLAGYKNNLERLPKTIDQQLSEIIEKYKETDNPVLVTYQMNL
jgi:glycosyltransferase involved in cell wall biosynthesis